MAKQTHKTFSQVRQYNQLYWFPDLNEARGTEDYGDENQRKLLRSLLFEHGWRQTSHGTIDAEPMSAALQERATKELKAQYDMLLEKSQSNAEMALQLKVFQIIRCDAKGKLITPELSGISGNRRDSVFFAAMCDRFRKNLPVTTEIPCVIYPAGLSAADRLEIQCAENEMRDEGALEMSNGDRLKAARRRLELGGKEADLNRMFKRGMSQKLWGAVRLDALWPDLNIVKRMCLPSTEPGYIHFSSTDKEVLRMLAVRSDPEALKNFNIIEGAKSGKTATPATREQVEEYLLNPKGGKTPQIKSLDKAVVASQAKENTNRLIREVLDGVASNNVDPLKKYDAHALLLNCVLDLIDSGDGPPVELLVSKIVAKKNGDRVELIKKLIAACE